MRFLALTRKIVVDEQAIEAVDEIPAVPADDTTDPPTPAVPAVPGTAAKDAVTHEEVGSCWVETDVKQVAEATVAGTAEYYELSFDAALKPWLKKVRIKSGPAVPAPAREIREIETEDGDSIGSTIVDA